MHAIIRPRVHNKVLDRRVYIVIVHFPTNFGDSPGLLSCKRRARAIDEVLERKTSGLSRRRNRGLGLLSRRYKDTIETCSCKDPLWVQATVWMLWVSLPLRLFPSSSRSLLLSILSFSSVSSSRLAAVTRRYSLGPETRKVMREKR